MTDTPTLYELADRANKLWPVDVSQRALWHSLGDGVVFSKNLGQRLSFQAVIQYRPDADLPFRAGLRLLRTPGDTLVILAPTLTNTFDEAIGVLQQAWRDHLEALASISLEVPA